MKLVLNILLLLTSICSYANMANPVMEGTLGSRPFVSQYVDVIHEDLSITIDENFDKAVFEVKYHITSSENGKQIPFLFYASECFDLFTVKIDGMEIYIQDVPNNLKAPENSRFSDFSYFFESSEHRTRSSVKIDESPSSGFTVELRDMKFFVADISEGDHLIEVTYKATKWIDSWNWVQEFSFRYALSPAKYWKSFGTLDITLDAQKFKGHLTSNVNPPNQGNMDSIAAWQFNSLPTEILHITYIPEISNTASNLIKVGPDGLATGTGILLILIHFLWISRYRRKKPSKKYSLAVILGSLLVPLVFFISWMYYYSLIDTLIGEFAGRAHGYAFLTILLYPFILPVYWLISWLIDQFIKERQMNKIGRQ